MRGITRKEFLPKAKKYLATINAEDFNNALTNDLNNACMTNTDVLTRLQMLSTRRVFPCGLNDYTFREFILGAIEQGYLKRR